MEAIVLTQAIVELGSPNLVGLFNRMEVAEEIIARAKAEYADQADAIDRTFGLCCPSPVLREAPERLYRLHVEELTDRIRQQLDTRSATDGELLSLLSQLSIVAPLGQNRTALYVRLFCQHFDSSGIPDMPAYPTYKGADREVEATLRERLYQIDRKLQRKGKEPNHV